MASKIIFVVVDRSHWGSNRFWNFITIRISAQILDSLFPVAVVPADVNLEISVVQSRSIIVRFFCKRIVRKTAQLWIFTDFRSFYIENKKKLKLKELKLNLWFLFLYSLQEISSKNDKEKMRSDQSCKFAELSWRAQLSSGVFKSAPSAEQINWAGFAGTWPDFRNLQLIKTVWPLELRIEPS